MLAWLLFNWGSVPTICSFILSRPCRVVLRIRHVSGSCGHDRSNSSDTKAPPLKWGTSLWEGLPVSAVDKFLQVWVIRDPLVPFDSCNGQKLQLLQVPPQNLRSNSIPSRLFRCTCMVLTRFRAPGCRHFLPSRSLPFAAFGRAAKVGLWEGLYTWLSLGNILHSCLLWFSGKSPLNC